MRVHIRRFLGFLSTSLFILVLSAVTPIQAAQSPKRDSLPNPPQTADRLSATSADTVGDADTCDVAKTTTGFAAIGETDTQNLTIELGGDEDWYTIEVATGDPTGGLEFRIETFTDQPALFPPSGDDSTLWLYSTCPGTPAKLINFNEDKPGSFMSRIDTACLPEGTYYLRINAFKGNPIFKADNIDLQIEVTGACNFVIPDSYEPDDSRDDANTIDLGQAGIQAHSIFPATDNDWVKFGLAENTLVDVRTARSFPTVLNGFAAGADPSDFDTNISLWYASPNVPVAGLCNQQLSPGVLVDTIDNGCNVDADCSANVDPFPGLPDCVTWNFFGPGTTPINAVDNPLAQNHDAGVLGSQGSGLTLCLPRTDDSQSASVLADPAATFNWYVRANGFGTTFDYELLVDDLGPCNFESEPNDDPASANDLVLDVDVNGIFDYSASSPAGDEDFFKFDVPVSAWYGIETHSNDPATTDTFIELIVGPDLDGEFFLTGLADDDGGRGLLSRIDTILAPACELLDTCGAAGGGVDTAYYINMAPALVQPNFPYRLSVNAIADRLIETVDYEDCDVAQNRAFLNDRFKASLSTTCDFDGFRFFLEEDTNVVLETNPVLGGAIDTSMQLVDCDSMSPIACDEDGGVGYASLITGCLPGGHDYCVRVRPWSGLSTFDYELDLGVAVTDNGHCNATNPPTLTADGASNCASAVDFNTGGGCTETFDTCAELCGNGIVDPGDREDCDDAGASAACDADCSLVVCGDGQLNALAGEACDDGNLMNGDGCSATCEVEVICPEGSLLRGLLSSVRTHGDFRDAECVGLRPGQSPFSLLLEPPLDDAYYYRTCETGCTIP